MPQQALANGTTGGFLLAILTAMLATLGNDLSFQAAEILGMLVMLGGALLTQGYALWKTPGTIDAAFPVRLKTAMAATVAMCLAYGLLLWIHYAFLDPDYLQQFFLRYREEILAAAANAEDLASRETFVEQNREFLLDPFKQAMLMAGTLLAIGGLGAVLASALLRRRSD